MASQVGGLIYDENLNVHYNASAGGKTNVSKALKKGGLGGRKPLGDLPNLVQPTPTFDGSKKKSISKASEKPHTSTRKALLDISNSGKPHLREASNKKNLTAKLSVLEEERLSAVAEEGFLHNHQECLKARTKAMDIDELLITVGLDDGFSKQSVSPWVASPALEDFKFRPASPPRYLELEELEEHGLGDAQSPQKTGNPQAAQLAVCVVMILAVTEAITVSTTLFCCRNVLGYAFSNDKGVVNYVGIARGSGWQHIEAHVNFGAYYLVGNPAAALPCFAMHILRGNHG